MTQSKHTAGPWKSEENTAAEELWPEYTLSVFDASGGYVAEVMCHTSPETTQANAKFIVRACNSHADLLAALGRLATSSGALDDDYECDCDKNHPCQLCEARAAIAKAIT